MSDTDARDLSLSEGFALVGQFIVRFSVLDARLSEFVTQFFRMSDRNEWADSLVHTIDCSRKCEILKSFCHGLDAFKDLKKTVEKIEKVSAARNIAAHGLMGRYEDGVLYLRLYGTPKFLRGVSSFGSMKVADIADFLERIDECEALLESHTRDTRGMFALMDAGEK